MKVVAHRWVENVPVIGRLLEILPQLKQYVKAVDEKKLKNPGTKSFEVVKANCADALAEVKLNFILTVAKRFQPYLKMYQVDKPMMPFLVPDLLKLIKDMLARFIKRDIVESLKCCNDVVSFDTSEQSNHCSSVDMGFTAHKILKSDAFKKLKLSDKSLRDLQSDAKSVLVAVCKKLLQKTPIKYPLVRALTCLDPRNMAATPEQCRIMMKRFLASCVESKHVSETDCDDILMQFMDFIHQTSKSELENFDIENDRIDTFFQRNMASKYPKAWTVVEFALLISHGQASVERGFSINKEMIVENQEVTSLMARRLIKDHVMCVNGVTNVAITREMVLAARSARAKYSNFLAQKAEREQAKKLDLKRKAETEAINELQNKSKRLKTDISGLLQSSKEFYDKCEATGKVTFVSKANSLRRTAEEKQKQVDKLDKEIAERLLALKQ